MSRFVTYSVVALLSLFGGLALAQSPEPLQVDIAAQPLGDALNQFAEQSGLQVVLYADDAKGIHVAGVSGQFDRATVALDTLLVSTGLEYSFINDRTVAVTPAKQVAEQGGDSDPGNRAAAGATPTVTAQNQTRVQQSQARQPKEQESQSEREKRPIEEIVVTGTNIRGIGSPASPVVTLDREDIARTGLGQFSQVLETLPQNTGGQRTSYSSSSAGGDDANFSKGTGVDLRGMGGDATLILVDGRRLAPNGLGSFVNTSVIPVDAVDRVEILTDGASAIYGSDAIAGVVNIILRDNYEGAGARLRYGSVTHGAYYEMQAGAVAGNNWNGGSALLSYTHSRHSELNAQDRVFSQDSVDPTWLIGQRRADSVLGRVEQSVGTRLDLYADVLYSASKTDSVSSSLLAGNPRIVGQKYESEQIGGTVGARLGLSDSWVAELTAAYDTSGTQFVNTIDGADVSPFDSDLNVWSVDLKTDGEVFATPAGVAKIAVGGQFRRESYESSGERLPSTDKRERDVAAVFGELFIPIVGADNARTGMRSLTLSLAARWEHYSDFGNTTNPKIGLTWTPVQGMDWRATYGTSFRAPTFYELDDIGMLRGTSLLIFPFPDPQSASGATPTLYISSTGGNPNLGPEESTQWTFGMDLHPAALPNWALSLTYFDIDFTDRIASPLQGSLLDLLANEDSNPTLVRDPPLALVNEFYPLIPISRTFGFAAADVGALFDNRPLNIAARRETGLDVSIDYTRSLRRGTLTAQLAGAYMFKLEDQLLPTLPPIEAFNMVYRPVDLRVRGGVNWTDGGMSLSVFVNHVDSYRDTRIGSRGPIDSWTTVDTMLSYAWDDGAASPLLRGVTATISAQNLFDQDPPFVPGLRGINFDSTNASPLGRFVALELRKQW